MGALTDAICPNGDFTYHHLAGKIPRICPNCGEFLDMYKKCPNPIVVENQ